VSGGDGIAVVLENRPAKRPTKKSLIESARAIIDRNVLGVPFSADDLIEFSRVTGTEVRFAVRRVNPTWPTDPRHIHAVVHDWESAGEWSWVKAINIDRDRDPEQAAAMRRRFNEQKALREAIREQLQEFRECCEPQQCETCSSTDNLCADHFDPPFIEIANEFLTRFAPIALRPFPGTCDRIADPDVEAAWIAFHARRATYQLLCRSCNSRKGARRCV
jgi:hypothetical protein